MKTLIKRTGAFAIIVMVLLCAMPLSASAYSGQCGDNVTYTFDSYEGTLEISGTGPMYNYTSTEQPWYSYTDNIENIKLNNGVTTIGDYSFSHCANLKYIEISDSATYIGKKAFSECGLYEVTIPGSVRTIAEGAFSDCDSLERATLDDGIEIIGVDAFSDCDYLASVSIGDGVTTIEERAFKDCPKLREVRIPETVTTIGKLAFFCENLSDVYYQGSKAQWKKIDIDYDGYRAFFTPHLKKATIHYGIGQANSITPLIIPASIIIIALVVIVVVICKKKRSK